jgi:hypothetical protein
VLVLLKGRHEAIGSTPTSRYRHIARVPNSVMMFTSPRYALLAILALPLMGCTMAYDLTDIRAYGVQPAEQKAQCERMDRLLGDKTLSPQQIEAVRATMNTHGCQAQ